MTGILNTLIAGVSGAVKDAYFNLVSLLLPGDGTNGAQNNTFLDGSSNNFTITRNGNTTQGTFSPFSQTGWGNYFEGSSAYLNGDGSAGLALSTGDFTIEFWTFVNSTSGNPQFISFNPASTNGAYPLIYLNSGVLTYYVNDTAVITGASVSTGVWNHIALSRSGTSTKMFLNGTQTGSTYTDTNNYLVGTSRPTIGRAGFSAAGYLNGYISNLRVVKGRAVYTTTFTPPISPLGLTSGGVNPPQGSETKLLTCQSNRFVDAAGTTITVNGSPSVTPFSPFAPTAAYSASAVGGSGYFDGTGDYLSIADNAAFTMGTGDFTVEAWVYCTAADFASSRYIVAQRNASADTSISFAINLVGGGARKVRLLCFDSGGASYEAICASDVINLNEWTHIAGVRNGATLRIYVNGVQQGTANISTASLVDSDGGVAIGRLGDANLYYWLGYISGLRITKGGCLYPSGTTFTPPTAPPTTTVSSGTVSLLTNFTNAGVVDATAKNVLETVGNAQISTTQSKWGGGSISIPKTSTDYLKSNLPVTDLCAFGSGDFVIEFWLRLAAVPGSGQIGIVYDSRPSATNGAYAMLYIDNATLKYYVSSADRITGSALSINTWYYIAVARASGSTRLYIDGTQQGSTYSDSTVYLNGSQRPLIGTSGNSPSSSEAINGFIDDLRVTKGSARGYSGSTITVPTAPFPVQ